MVWLSSICYIAFHHSKKKIKYLLSVSANMFVPQYSIYILIKTELQMENINLTKLTSHRKY